ncbi:MAG: pyridoxal-dependent decarboxylase [Microthrixaceae bacterium]|nr:pyridoxal-dependent decarboxylase [Microthrixaceae bacterium]
MSYYPYADRFPVNRTLPEQGRDRAEVLAELRTMAAEEDRSWQSGKVSGSYYCGDVEHYGFMTEAFGLFAHVNALQRDVCPSATRFEGEVIAMTLDMLGGASITDTTPGGILTSGGTGSILHALLAYRDHAREQRGITRPNVVKPETGHPAFDKACHLFGIEMRRAPVDPETATADVAAVSGLVDENTIAIIGSACNYGYGTVDPITELGRVAIDAGTGLHVDGCLGGFILPWGRELGYDIEAFDFSVPGVTSMSADTHKYGYGFKGTSVVLFRDTAVRNSQYFYLTDWTGGKYCSPGMDGSRSSGLLAATWSAMLTYGRSGYRAKAAEIFAVAARMQDAVRSHAELRIIGSPTFCFSFTSDEFDIYHVNDFMSQRGWRFNGQQYPNAIHMAVTGPQTQDGVVGLFEADLAEAVGYAIAKGDEPAASAAIYGSVPGGFTEEADEFIRQIMADMMDHQQGVPAP